MKNLLILTIAAAIVVGCASRPIDSSRKIASESQIPQNWNNPEDRKILRALLVQRRDQVKTWATLCQPGQNVSVPAPYTNYIDSKFDRQFSATSSSCSQGDLMIFGGFSEIGAWFSGDVAWALARHEEQHLSQEKSGRWVRGPSWVGLDRAANAFSRDQGTGLRLYFIVALDRIARETNSTLKHELEERYRNEMKKWLTWIETEGRGKMCAGDQRCEINGFFGSSLYRVAKRLGAIDSSTQRFKVVKKMKTLSQLFGGAEWAAETALTPIDYQMLLKMADIFIESYLQELDVNWIRTGAMLMHKKDPTHTLYAFLANGNSPALVEDVLSRCSENAQAHDRSLFQWMHPSINQTSARSNGHDCLLLLNFMIADLDKRVPWLPNNQTDESQNSSQLCPKHLQTLGVYGELPVCEKPRTLRAARCDQGSVIWADKHTHQNYCLILDSDYYAAHALQEKPCPASFDFEGWHSFSYAEWPMCKARLSTSLSEVACSTIKDIWAGKATFVTNINGKRFCTIPQDGWYKLREISRVCPLGRKYLGMIWDSWPVCEELIDIKINKDDCPSKPDGSQQQYRSQITQKEYCIQQSDFHFKAREISNPQERANSSLNSP